MRLKCSCVAFQRNSSSVVGSVRSPSQDVTNLGNVICCCRTTTTSYFRRFRCRLFLIL